MERLKQYLFFFIILFYAGNVFALSDEAETAIGRQVDSTIKWEYGVMENQQINKYIEHVGLKLVSVCERQDIVYHFVVLNTKKINTMAVPGGYIYITKGFLVRMQSEAELAAALAHELVHIARRHGIEEIEKNMELTTGMVTRGMPVALQTRKTSKKMDAILRGANTAYYFAKLGYGKKLETEGYLKGTEYLLKAGYPSEAMIKMLDIIQIEEKRKPRLVLGFLRSHPKKTTKKIDQIRVMQDNLKEKNAALYDSATGNYYPENYKTNVLDIINSVGK